MNPCVISAPAAAPTPAAFAGPAFASPAAAAQSGTPGGSFADLLMAAQVNAQVDVEGNAHVDAEVAPGKAFPQNVFAQALLPETQEVPSTGDVRIADAEVAAGEAPHKDTAALMYAFVEAMPSAPLPSTEKTTPAKQEPAAKVSAAGLPVEPAVQSSPEEDTLALLALPAPPPAMKEAPVESAQEIDEPDDPTAEPIEGAPVGLPGPTPEQLNMMPVTVPQPAAAPMRTNGAPVQMDHTDLAALTRAASSPSGPNVTDNVRIGVASSPAPEASPQAPVVFEAHITAKNQTAKSQPNEQIKPEKAMALEQPASVSKDLRIDAQAPTPVKEVGHSASPDSDAEPDAMPEAPKPSEPAAKQLNTAFALHEPASSGDVKPQAPEAVRRPAVVLEQPEPAASARTPLKQMDVRIPDANGDVVVRIQERAGGVQVSVRSNDSQMAGNLAQNLPELTGALDQQGFRAHTWTPRDASASFGDSAAIAQPEASQQSSHQNEPEHQESQPNPDWQEEPRRRPKRQPEENFKEQL